MRTRILSLAFVGALVLVSGAVACGNDGDDEAVGALDRETLLNGTYVDSTGTEVTLVDGIYERPSANGSRGSVTLHEEIALGDIGGDANIDAVVVLADNGGGSGTFISLVAVLNVDGTPSPSAYASLGDRVVVHSVAVESGVITVDMTKHDADDPLCCPTLRVSSEYELQESELVLLEKPA